MPTLLPRDWPNGLDPREVVSYIRALGPDASELNRQCAYLIERQFGLLCRWRAAAKALGFGKKNAEIADYCDELASELPVLTKETIAATEYPA